MAKRKKNRNKKPDQVQTQNQDQDQKKNEDWDDWDEDEENADSEEESEEEEGDAEPWEEESEEEVEEEEDEETSEEEEEPAVELDPEDPNAVPDKYYTVQMGYEEGDAVVSAGTSIPVLCKNCALWETPLAAHGGKPRCKAGVSIDVQVADEQFSWRMQEDRFSCQQYFIPMELKDLLTYVTDDARTVKVLLMAASAARIAVKLQERIKGYCHRHNVENPGLMIDNALDVLTMFSSEEQINYVKPFLDATYKGLKSATQKKVAQRRSKFSSGDYVSWEAVPGGSRVQGFIRSIGGRHGLITLMVAGESVRILDPDYAAGWEEKNPETSLTRLRIQIKYKKDEWLKRSPELLEEIPVLDTVE